MNKPVAESCLQNQQPILDALRDVFSEAGEVLEVGSGTGQHAVFFSQHLPHLEWQPSDLQEQHPGMLLWLNEVKHDRIRPPLVLDVDDEIWPVENMDYVFTANTTHIISLSQAERMFAHIASVLKQGGLFAQYGPFNYNGKYTSESNARFDQWLKQQHPLSCIKHFEQLQAFATENAMDCIDDIEMPANNRLLVWQKQS